MLLSLVFACAGPPTGPGTVLTAPDAGRDGGQGADGPYGAAALSFEVLARATDVVEARVVFPADADGWPDPAALPAPTVLFVHGGGVEAERYLWLAAHLATRGYVTVLPSHGRDLAFFEPDNAIYAWDQVGAWAGEPGALAGLIDPEADAIAMGHSLGAVVAAQLWVSEPRIAGVGMLAGYPAGGADVTSRAGSPALAVAGSADGLSPPETIEAQLADIAEPLQYTVIPGMNHFAWTDDPTARELARDGALEGDLGEIRALAMSVLDAWLDPVAP